MLSRQGARMRLLSWIRCGQVESKTQQSLRFNLQNQGSSVGEHHTDPTYLLVACRRAKGHGGDCYRGYAAGQNK